jgi:hypothetical protein
VISRLPALGILVAASTPPADPERTGAVPDIRLPQEVSRAPANSLSAAEQLAQLLSIHVLWIIEGVWS